MNLNALLRLPVLISQARCSSGRSQRAVAKSLGIHASQLCGMEKGRLRIVRPDFLAEFSQVVGLADDQLRQLRWALAHDQVLAEAREFGLSDAALELVSLALQAERELDSQAVRGIHQLLGRALRGQRELSALAASATSPREEAVMT